MGAAGSVAEITKAEVDKPADASDLVDLAAARAELKRLRLLARDFLEDLNQQQSTPAVGETAAAAAAAAAASTTTTATAAEGEGGGGETSAIATDTE